MANQVSARIVNAINNPFPSILNNLQNLNSQLNYAVSQLDSNGVTLGTLTASRRNSKPFIIGFIPPDNPINFIPIQSSPQQIGKISQIAANNGPNTSAAALPDDFFITLQQISNNANLRPQDLIALMYNEGSAHGQNLVSDAVNRAPDGHPIAKGLIQFTLSALNASRMTRDQWDNLENTGPTYQLQFVQNFFRRVSGGRPYTSYPQLYLANFTSNYYPDPTTLDPNTVLFPAGSLASQQNKAFSNGGTGDITVGNFLNAVKNVPYSQGVKNVIAQYNSVISGNIVNPSIVNNDDVARGLMTYGSSGLKDDPLQNALGRNITVANAKRQALALKQTQALQDQINAITNTPPLILLVNPREFSRSYQQNADDSPTTRYGHIINRWLEKPIEITGQGTTAGQYIVDASGNGGLTNFYRVHSLSYQNLLSLLGIYKNNGMIFAGQESDPGIPIVAMSLFIYYDNHIYIGSFDEFGIDDSGDKPYNMEYNFKFTVRYDLEMDGINQILDFSVVNQLQTGGPIPSTIPQSQVQINQTPPEAANFAGFGTPGNTT